MIRLLPRSTRTTALLPSTPLFRSGDLLGGRAQRADVAARGGLGQVHRAGPFAGNQLRKPGLALLLGAIGHQRVDRPRRQDAAQRKAHVGAAERLDNAGREGEGQVLPAIVAGAVDAVPASLDELPVRLLEARGHGARAHYTLWHVT